MALSVAVALCAVPAAAGPGDGPPKLLKVGGAPSAAPIPKPRPQRPGRLSTKARNAIVLDLSRGAVLFERGAEEPIPPASMTKLMTLLVALEALETGRLSMESRVEVGARAASRPGSSMFLEPGDRPRIKDLLHGLIVQSGNDAAVALAEGVAGSERTFVARMNAAAESLGLEQSRFKNPTGLTARGHAMSVGDLAALAAHLLDEHPEARSVFRTRRYAWAGVEQRNRNPLLFADLSDIGVAVDGMKTGYTAAAGYCAVVSAVQRRRGAPPRRVIAVLAGLSSEAERAREAEQAVRWAFRQETPRALKAARPEAPRRASRGAYAER